MGAESIQFLKSQSSFVSEIIKNILNKDGFVLLSGDGGTGKSVICEQVINATDGRSQSIFIPCNKDMSLVKLREHFLDQFSNSTDFDSKKHLVESLPPQRFLNHKKILVVMDNADSITTAFYDELKKLYDEYQGQDRFSCLLTGKPSWVKTRIKRNKGAEVTSMEVPPVTMEEALNLCLNMFRVKGLLPEFRSIEKGLPALMADCNGNIERIIAKSEQLMKEPNLNSSFNINDLSRKPQRDVDVSIDQGEKKSGSFGLFITIICIAVVLVCLIPLFVGGGLSTITNMFSGKEEVKATTVPRRTPPTTVTPTTAPPSQTASADGVTTDTGTLNQPVPAGIETQAPAPETTRQTVIDGKALDDIEAKNPRRGLGTNVDPNAPLRVQHPIQSDNKLRATEIAQRAALESRQRRIQEEAERAAMREQSLNASAASGTTAPAAPAASAPAATPAAASTPAATPARSASTAGRVQPAAASSSRSNSGTQSGIVMSETVRSSGMAIAGDESELLQKNSSSYTLQVLAGSRRDKIQEASAGISGRYWVYQTVHNGKPWYVLVTGEYQTVAEATASIKKLPQSLVRAKPFPKSFGKIKQEMNSR